MKEFINVLVRLIRVGKQAYAKKWSFFSIFAVIFLGSVVLLATFDMLPEALPATVSVVASTPEIILDMEISKGVEIIELPIKIEISAINLSISIANPTTVDIKILDEALLKGAVRYPTSAKLGEVGNIVLFGHSSYLPVVGNKAYKAFNGIQKLVAGDVVTVYSSGTAYTYRVRSVAKESAASDAGIDLQVTGRVLTLATCNSFGAKEDRFIVTADFVESHAISS